MERFAMYRGVAAAGEVARAGSFDHHGERGELHTILATLAALCMQEHNLKTRLLASNGMGRGSDELSAMMRNEKPRILLVRYPVLHVFVNAKHTGSHWAEGGGYSFVFEKYVQLHRGVNTVSMLSGTVGLPNYGPFYDRTVAGVVGPVKLVAPNGQEVAISTSKWGYDVGVLGLDSEHLYSDDVQRRWHSNYVQTGKPLTWYRTCFDSPQGDDPVVLDLEGMRKGTAWVNGNNIGRYWPSYKSPSWGCDHCNYAEAYDPNKNCRTGCGGPSQKWYHVPRSFLNPDGDNSLVLFEEFGGNPKHVSVHTVGNPEV